jgi:hypothetical protein
MIESGVSSVVSPWQAAANATQEGTADKIKRLLARGARSQAWCEERRWANTVRMGALSDANERAKWLEKGIEEDPEEFKKRARLSTYAPLCPLIAQRFSGAVWKRPPTRTFPGVPELEEFAKCATRGALGQPLDNVTQNAVLHALWGRYSIALIDRPPIVSGAEPVTEADDSEMGLDRSFVALYDAEAIYDWRTNDEGNLSYCKLVGPYMEPDPSDPAILRTVVREVSAAGIVVHTITQKGKDGEQTLGTAPAVPIADGLLAAGLLPLVPCNVTPMHGDALAGESPLVGALMAELGAFRKNSEIEWISWLAANPIMICTVKGSLGGIGVGVNKYIKLDPGKEQGGEKTPPDKIEWLEAQLHGLTELKAQYETKRQEIWQQAAVSPQAQTQRADAQSGVSIAWSFETAEANTLSEVARAAQRFERALLLIVGLCDTDKAADGIADGVTVDYPSDFSVQAPEKLLTYAQTIKNANVSETATRCAWKKAIAAQTDGLSPDLKKKIEAEIDAADMEPPALPDMMGGAPPFNRNKKPLTGAVAGGPGAKKAAG